MSHYGDSFKRRLREMTSATPQPRAGEHVPLPPNACSQCGQIGGEHLAHCLIAERDALEAQNRALREALDQQERFKWAGNKRIEELAAVLKQIADRLSAWRDGAHIAFNATGSDEQYNLRGNYDGLLSAIEAVMVETLTTKHGR